MSALAKIAVACLPGGAVLLAAGWLLRCRHRHELLSAVAGGAMGLRCAACGRTRPHPFGGEPVRFHRTQAAGQPSGNSGQLTGIKRESERYRAEMAAVNSALAKIEQREKFHRARLRVVKRFGQ